MLAAYMQTLNQEDLRDMVVCEAIKRAVGELDGEVRRFSNAGMSHATHSSCTKSPKKTIYYFHFAIRYQI